MKGLRGRLPCSPLSLNVMIVLCIWLLVAGLAWADSFDLTDDVGVPFVSAGVIVDSDGDEVREKLATAWTSGVLSEHMPTTARPHIVAGLIARLSLEPSHIPLYQQLCSFRI